MIIYFINLEIKPYKVDEFVNSMQSFSYRIRNDNECLDFNLYRDSEKENSYIVIGNWKTRQAMEQHFKTHEFEVFIGATRVLGETFEMNIAEVFKSGGLELARAQITSQDRGSVEGN